MYGRSLQIVLLIIVFAAATFAQSVHTPDPGSAERKAILGALRMPVERELKQKIVFAADMFKVQGNWAFISGTPQKPGGSRPDYRGTIYADAVDSGAFDNNFFALLKKAGGRWKVTKFAIGCTDVCYEDWWRRYGAPKAIFAISD